MPLSNSISTVTSPTDHKTASELAAAVRDILERSQRRLVLVESCTAGRVAATLGIIPGISQWLCGSLVVYRNGSKSAWLGVPQSLLDDPQQGPVSSAASRYLALAALQRTPEADVSIAITGDIGPNAPAATDGMVYLAAVLRRKLGSREEAFVSSEQQNRLSAPTPRDNSDTAARLARLEEATIVALRFALQQ